MTESRDEVGGVQTHAIESNSLSVTLADVQAAKARLSSVIPKTPCARSETLSERFDCNVFLKLENLQMTGSFNDENPWLGVTAAVALLQLDARKNNDA